MKQIFTKIYHNKFIKHFNIKPFSSDIELAFYKKTYKYIKYIKWLPGLQMIGIGNSISMNCATSNSDIDLLIVSSNNSMWLNRVIITLIFQILGVRKTNKKHSGRFCLSFFTTIKGLDFSSWKIENDIYLYFWIIYFKPILNYNNTYELFLKKNNSWANFNEYSEIINENKKYIKYIGTNKSKDNFLIKIINYLLKLMFIKKTTYHYKKIGKPYGVIINNNLLKFHNGDIRQKIKEELS